MLDRHLRGAVVKPNGFIVTSACVYIFLIAGTPNSSDCSLSFFCQRLEFFEAFAYLRGL